MIYHPLVNVAMILAMVTSFWSPSFSGHVIHNQTIDRLARTDLDEYKNWLSAIEAHIQLTEHPRLFFDADELGVLRSKAASTHKDIWSPIYDHVSSLTGIAGLAGANLQPPSDMDGFRYAGDEMFALAFSCVITNDPAICGTAKNYLLTYADWEAWDEQYRRGLGHAHMLQGNALAYDWLYERLTPDERVHASVSLALRAEQMYEASIQSYNEAWGNWWRRSPIQNHYWVVYSALGIAALALEGADDRSETWLTLATERLNQGRILLEGNGDGSWHEGIPYQSYTLTMSLPFLVNLKRLKGVDILPYRYLSNYADWRLYNFIPGILEPLMTHGNFEHEWYGVHREFGLLRFSAAQFGNEQAEWLVQQMNTAIGRSAGNWTMASYVFEFLYYDSTIQAQPPVDRTLERLFPDLEGVIWRTGWEDEDIVFGLKSGAYGGRFAFDTFTQETFPWDTPCEVTGCQLNAGHDHDDTNTFYLYRNGQSLAIESIGVGNSATSFHNTILVDGQGQYRPSAEGYWERAADLSNSDGFVSAYAIVPGFRYVASNATRRYSHIDAFEDITRHVLFVDPDYFLMWDNIAGGDVHDYDWTLHFGGDIVRENDWLRGEAQDDQLLGVKVVSPEQHIVTTGNDGQPYVRIRPPAPKVDVRFLILLFPADCDSWHERPSATLLAETDTSMAVRVVHDRGGDDIFITFDDRQSVSTVGPYEHDGQIGVIQRNGDGELMALFVHGGTYLADVDRQQTLVDGLQNATSFLAQYDNAFVDVHIDGAGEFYLFAPRTDRLRVNGATHPFTQVGQYIRFHVPGD